MEYEMKMDALASAFEGADFPGGGRLPLSGAVAGGYAQNAFINGFVRQGIDRELKSLNISAGGEGGYAVPREIDAEIGALLKNASPIRSIANVVQVGSSGYRKLVTQNGVASGWAAETAARGETATPIFHEVVPSFGELYANPAATQAMLDDAQFDVESWLAGEIATEFARAEGAAFINGDGVDKPMGFLNAPHDVAGDAARAFGTLQYLPSGVDGDFAVAMPENSLIDMVHALRAPYRQGAVWVMNSATLATIRKMKTADGAFIWQAGLGAGQPDILLGYPVVEAEDMPDIAPDSLSIAFGNFRTGYLIAERGETSIIRDPYSNKPYVHFYATKRVGGVIANSDAIKLMKFSAA